MLDLNSLMERLALNRPIFHSEADFQHAFAWELHRTLKMAAIRLERPIRLQDKTLHLDLLAQTEERKFAIELKYKTHRLALTVSDEAFHLANQSATDIGRYDFIKDICRLEAMTADWSDCTGWAILLTNESAYWKAGSSSTIDTAFRLTEGRILHGSLKWAKNASPGTMRNRESALILSNPYRLHWNDYAEPSNVAYSKFRYLAVPVHKTA